MRIFCLVCGCLVATLVAGQDSITYFGSTTGAACQEVEYYNDHLYTGLGTTLRVYDVGPGASVPFDSIFEYRYRSHINDLKIHNGYLYVAANHDGITKWDISNPAALQIVASYVPDSIREAAYDIEFRGDSLIVAYSTKVAVFIDQGSSFQKIAEFGYTGGSGNGLVIGGAVKDTLYACAVSYSNLSANDGIYIYSMNDFSLLSWYPQTFADPEDLVFGINTNMLHVAGGTQSSNNMADPRGLFYTLDISDPFNPVPVLRDTIPGLLLIAIAAPYNLVNVNDTIYLATTAGLKPSQFIPDTTWVYVYDATSQGNVQLITYLPAGLWHFDVCVDPPKIFIASEWFGIKTLDATDLMNPVDMGNTLTGGWNVGADIYGNTLLVANEGYGFKKYDITDPVHPVLTGVNQAGTFCHYLKFSDDGQYIFAFYSTSVSMRVFETATLQQVDSISTSGLANGNIDLWGNILFTSKPQALNMFDVSNPTSVSLTASFSISVNDMQIQNGRLYIAGNDSISVYDVSSGFQKRASLFIGTFGNADELAVWKDTIFTWISGLGFEKIARYIFDPVNDTILLDGYFTTGLTKPAPQAMAADSFGLYIAYNLHGLRMYDKATLNETDSFKTGLDFKEETTMHGVRDLYCYNQKIFLAEYFGQVSIFTGSNGVPVSADSELRGENDAGTPRIYPNPFHSEAILEVPGVVTQGFLEIYDRYGRCVLHRPARGSERIRLNRKDLASGAYTYIIHNGNDRVAGGSFVVN